MKLRFSGEEFEQSAVRFRKQNSDSDATEKCIYTGSRVTVKVTANLCCQFTCEKSQEIEQESRLLLLNPSASLSSEIGECQKKMGIVFRHNPSMSRKSQPFFYLRW